MALRRILDAPRETTILFGTIIAIEIVSLGFGTRRFFSSVVAPELALQPSGSLYANLYWFLAEFLLGFLVPLVVIRSWLRRSPASFGTGLGDVRTGVRLVVACVLVMVPVVWVASDAAAFRDVYPHAQMLKEQWRLLPLYEAALLLYFVGWEFLWRGYMLFGLEPVVGAGTAVFMQTLPFTLLHAGKPLPELVGAAIAGIALGALALRTRSFWYGVVVHWCVMTSMDVLSIVRYRGHIDGIGWDALRSVGSLILR